MINEIAKLIFLLHHLLFLLNGAMAVESPCPEYFRYIRNNNFEDMGQVEIPWPPKNMALHLKIELTVATSLPSKYVGRLELAQSKEESVRAVQQGRSLFYLVHFPISQPLPILTNIWFNEQLYCSGPRALGRIVTSIVLEHTLFPPRILTISPNQGNNLDTQPNFNDFIPFNQILSPSLIQETPSPLPSPLPLPQPPPSLPPPRPSPQPSSQPSPQLYPIPNKMLSENKSLNDNGNDNCGRVNIPDNNINPLIAKGLETSPGQWPWLVAIFVVKIQFEFHCTGTLVTNKHIVTVAHCTRLDDVILPASTMLVSLGRYRLRDWREEGSVNREVKEYKLHPDYKGDIKDPTADADLAVITLWEPVEFSDFIKPICLWSGSNDLRDIVGSKGYVIGWGQDEFGKYLTNPHMAIVPIVSQEDCLWSNAGFVAFTSNRTFCAGSRNGIGPCNGDSGSGLVIRKTDGRYQLRGVVSRSILDRNTMSCDLSHYVVYVDVAKHLDWIRLQITL
ncbi:serine protease gd-like [Vespa crabro]|uniref:serine protease gd-like n=1 Tax=Vespa crabro TaxID=7445 RepID=UPI001F024287|nr:serine protease gd-like [Vespa crabro]XP_046834544.1 serine protease gd-like [Vespa crabro]